MLKTRKYIVITVLLFFTSVSQLFATGSVGTSGADFLELGIGSRSLSMGEAFTAQTNDIYSLYYNPAGLGSMLYPVLSIQHQELLLDSRMENISIAFPVSKGYLAFSNTLFWVPPFEKVDIDGNSAGDVYYYNGVTTMAYGYDMGFMYIGGSLKYIYQKIDTLFLHSVAVDMGILKGIYLYSPFDAPSRNFYMGLSVLNLGTTVEDAPLPRQLRLGLSYKPTKWFAFNFDLSENFIEFSDLYDFTYGLDESLRLYSGVEFSLFELLYLRGGYKFNDGGSYSFGLGFNYVVRNVTFAFDTSYTQVAEFGPNYSFNITFKLIPKVVTIEDKREAERHYKLGIKYFISNDLDSAIEEFNRCKDYNPYHKNIDRKIKDLEEIKKLKKRNEELDEELKRLE